MFPMAGLSINKLAARGADCAFRYIMLAFRRPK